ncbi:MAG: DUF6398 domain-containing protein [Candidatus Thermoplasmatota archaeon]|nr:DUF6398 domain-containing protein [Candidatus Thermoplasmatota archaeon]
MKERIEEKKHQLIKLTSDFCDKYLDNEYSNLSKKLILKMSRKRYVPFTTGRIEIWAAAVIYSLGQINFLFDKSFKPYVSPKDICNCFGTNQSTVSQKAKYIRDIFKMKYWDDEFSTNKMKEDNPFSKLVMLKSGLIVDIDTLASITNKAISNRERNDLNDESTEEVTNKKSSQKNNKQKCLNDY